MELSSDKGPHRLLGQDWIPWWVLLWICGLTVQTLFCRRWWTYSEFLLNTVQRTYSSSSCSLATCRPVPVSHIQKSLMDSPGLFCLLVCSVLIFPVMSRGILFIRCNQFLLYSCILPITGVIFSSFSAYLSYNLSKCIPLFFSYNPYLLLLFFLCLLLFF